MVPEQVALKTNLLYDALLSPNLGIEFRLAPKWSLDVSGNYNPFELSHGRQWKHWLVQPEVRRWRRETFRGGFVAGHVFGGQFNYSFDRYRSQGWAAGLGVGYGHAWRFGNWGIEAEIALGYARYGYSKYPCADCGRVLAKHTKNYAGPTKAALSIAYYFGGKAPAPVVEQPVLPPAPAVVDTVVIDPGPTFNFLLVEPPSTGIRSMDHSGSANIKFRTSRHDIDRDYMDNSAELGKILATVDSIRSLGNVRITGLWFKGYASPEGRYATNARLAEERTRALRDFVTGTYGLPADMAVSESEPENWQGLAAAVEASSMPHRDEILEIIASDLEPDARETRLRKRFPAEYAQLRKDVYPALRRTDYRIDYAHFYEVEEVSALREVNEAIVRRDFDRALALLAELPESAEAHYARGVLEALRGNYSQALEQLIIAKEQGLEAADSAIEQVRAAMEP